MKAYYNIQNIWNIIINLFNLTPYMWNIEKNIYYKLRRAARNFEKITINRLSAG